jgi:hypothetical protein
MVELGLLPDSFFCGSLFTPSIGLLPDGLFWGVVSAVNDDDIRSARNVNI